MEPAAPAGVVVVGSKFRVDGAEERGGAASTPGSEAQASALAPALALAIIETRTWVNEKGKEGGKAQRLIGETKGR